MDTQTWLPIVTLVLGWGLGLGSEWSREARTTKREREMRRKDRQYEAIIEAQDPLGKRFRLEYELTRDYGGSKRPRVSGLPIATRSGSKGPRESSRWTSP